MSQCLLCLEDLTSNNILSNPSHCKCGISLHLDCLKQIENSGLLCPICRIKKSQKIIVINYEDSPLFFICDSVLKFFLDRPNIITFLIFLLMSFIVSLVIIPKMLWIMLNDPEYRFSGIMITCGVIGFVIFLILLI